MKHPKFGRERKARKALLTGLAEELVTREKMHTTAARAKALRPLVEKVVTRSRRGGLGDIRLLRRRFTAPTVEKLITVIGPRYQGRAGGYTRVTKVPSRRRDGSPAAVIEFV